jgi:hypothetical protein
MTKVDFRDGLHGMHSLVGNYSIFYNPKSACTSVRNLFFALHANEINTPNVDPLIRNAPAVFPPSQDRLPEFKINIVRDPYQRLVSAFVDKVASLFYQPQLCTGHEIYRWRFGQDTQTWGNLTFMDFLNYLSKNRNFSDIHFQAQPVIGGDVELVRVEHLEEQLCDVYQRRRPELLDAVNQFFATPESHANRSANSRLDQKADILNPHTAPVRALGEMIKAGNGFSANLLISEATLPTLNALLVHEVEAHGYSVRAE